MLPRIVAFFQPCSFGLAISVFACRVLFVLIYSVPARTIHPRFVLAHSVQHFLCVPFLLAFQVQFSNRFLPRSFLSSIFPSVSVSLPLWPPLYDFPSSVQASRSLLLCISVQSMPQGHQVRFFPFSPSLAVPSVLFSLLSLPHSFSVRFCRFVYAFQCLFPYYSCRHGLTPAPDWYRFRIVANAYGNSWAGRCIVS